MIEKNIHQTWKSKNLPRKYINNQTEILLKNINYKYTLWSDEDNYNLIVKTFPEYITIYNKFPKIAQSDIARYVILYVFGGYYLDLDIKMKRSLDCIDSDSYEIILTYEHDIHAKHHKMNCIISNWFMGFKSGNKLLELIIRKIFNEYKEKMTNNEILTITGPFMLTSNILKHYDKFKVNILDYKLTNPFNKWEIWGNKIDYKEVESDVIMIHEYDGTWWRNNSRNNSNDQKRALFTIITPTIGRETLLVLKEKLKREKIPYVHLILWDNKRCENALNPKDLEDENTYCYEFRHPLYSNERSRNDVWLRSIGIQLARTEYIKFNDDDTWPEENHLEDALMFMRSKQLDYTYCIRRMWNRKDEILGLDNFESTGEKNKFGYTLIDNSSIFVNKRAASILQQVFTNYQIYGDDRYTSKHLKEHCKGERFNKVLMNHRCQPHLEKFFEENVTKET